MVQQPSLPAPHNMIQYDDNDDTGAKHDVMVLANSYRQAEDMDVISALEMSATLGQTNGSSSPGNNKNRKKYYYYTVDATWFRRAWPYLNAIRVDPQDPVSPTWKEDLGPISSSSTATSAAAQPPQHPTDFVVLGANVWLLLSHKFGVADHNHAHTFERPVVRHNHQTLVRVSETVSVEIPISGRFPYEQFVQQMAPPPPPVLPPPPPPPSNEEEEEDDLFPGIVDSDPDPHGSTLVDDDNMEEEEGYGDQRNEPANPNEDGPILLLPASTTTMYRRNNNDDSMREDDDDNENRSFPDAASDTTVRILRRRHGSGLGNLGNTCFMNSTLQCLAHTEPLQRYFLSGEFQNDLNRDNPLGTGGELALQFAHLLAEMWGSKQVMRRGSPVPQYAPENNNNSHHSMFSPASNVVYPRKFKETLGKHAEQFMGYDQHDSQELATYLLDALHEDCNRVTRKPYIEKPEQAEDETDQEASDKAWELHLKREDSRVLENFMGQVKSRVQCCTDGCERISTTFDPFMYLSVPIPGSEERVVRLTYVPLAPERRPITLAVKVSKTASVEELMEGLRQELPKVDLPQPAMEDLVACDIWQHNIFKWYDLEKNTVDEIRETDVTLVYEQRPLAEVRQIEEQIAATSLSDSADDVTAESLNIRDIKRTKLYQLDLPTLTRINRGDRWHDELEKYLSQPLTWLNAFNPTKGSSEDRVRIYRRMWSFIEQCHKVIAQKTEDDQKRKSSSNHNGDGDDENDASGATNGGSGGAILSMVGSTAADEETIQELSDKCDVFSFFKNVKSKHDVAILEFLAGKVYKKIVEMERQRKDVFPDGIHVELRLKTSLSNATPLVLRIPSDTTVYDFRQLIAHRMSRCLKAVPGGASLNDTSMYDADDPASATVSSSSSSSMMNGDADGSFLRQHHHPAAASNMHNGMGTPGTWIMRKAPLSFERKNVYGNNRSFKVFKQLGSIPKAGSLLLDGSISGSRTSSFVESDQPEEKELVAETVGEKGIVVVDLTDDIASESVDMFEWEAADEPKQIEEVAKDGLSVLDCIEKFCQMEQLEETEQWYCSKCKDHVCAWKQFHIYRSPPHLIIHLKRFQFSARSHRRSKIGVFVDFPLEGLDLTKQVLHWTDDEKPIYDCYAVSNHIGGLGGGHYTAYALNDDGVWCLYDDTRITPNIEPRNVVSDQAYCLYYRRRDVPVGQAFEMKLPTPEIVTMGPTLIQDPLLLTNGIAASGDRSSELSSSANMVVDEDDGAMDLGDMYHTPQDGSRSTSPASDNAAQDEYSFPDDEFSSHGDADPSLTDSGNLLPLQ